MKELKSLWEKTKKKRDKLEKSLVGCYIAFLRQVAIVYLKQGKRVFFRENRMVHWGEDNFGHLIIEGDEEVSEVFGEHIPEIYFETKIKEKIIKGYKEITEENIQDIKYEIWVDDLGKNRKSGIK